MLRFLVGLAVGAVVGLGQDTQTILAKVAQRYATLDGYQIEAVYEVGISGRANISQSSSKFRLDAVPKSHKLHVSCKQSDLPMEIISNGAITWNYLPSKSAYTQVDAVAAENEDQDAGEAEEDLASQFQNLAVSRFSALKPPFGSWRLNGTKSVKTENGKVACYLLEQKVGRGSVKLWVDEERWLVLRLETAPIQQDTTTAATLTVKRFEVQPPPDTSFTFVPPDGARRVDELHLPGYTPSFIGRPAADFSLKDLEGSVVRLSDLRGRIVVLDFWATWCPPCRHELPVMDKLSAELKGQNVVILGLNDEGASMVKSFYKKNEYSFTILEDTGRKVSRTYHANSIPNVFVIDRNGLIVRHLVGSHEKPEVMAALHEAGLQ